MLPTLHTVPDLSDRKLRLEAFGILCAGLFVATAVALQASHKPSHRDAATMMFVGSAVAGAFVAAARVYGRGGF